MTPHYTDDWLTVYGGDVRDVLPTLPADSVDCIVTSPPYWGLRDYGSDGQLGLEATPEQYVANLVDVFRELRRVLKPSGTCWLNLGDSYAGNGRGDTYSGFNERYHGSTSATDKQAATGQSRPVSVVLDPPVRQVPGRSPDHGDRLKPKDLVGIPWRVAFALQADGWWLRSDIIWSKPNPMPESVTDRPTKAHEYLFLLTKSARYYYDADAVREANASVDQNGNHIWTGKPVEQMRTAPHKESGRRYSGADLDPIKGEPGLRSMGYNSAGRNLRSVWSIATRPYPGAHFAVFPPELPERCIKAGSSERGVCPACGAPWERQTVKTTRFEGGSGKAGRTAEDANANGKWAGQQYGANIKLGPVVDVETTGWEPSCRHATLKPVSATILDPFAGSGTVGLVANRLSRRAILIDLNPAYLEQQMQRNAQTVVGL